MPVISKRIFMRLKDNTSKMKETNKSCVYIINEMSVSNSLYYSQKEDFIEGVGDYGNEWLPTLADHMHVFMTKG